MRLHEVRFSAVFGVTNTIVSHFLVMPQNFEMRGDSIVAAGGKLRVWCESQGGVPDSRYVYGEFVHGVINMK